MDLKQNERTRFLDKIDLTGDEPIILTEEIKEIVPVVNLDGVIADSASVVTKPKYGCVFNGCFYIITLRGKCPYLELFWSAFSHIRTEHGEILRISSSSVRMRGNTDHNNYKYEHFLRSIRFLAIQPGTAAKQKKCCFLLHVVRMISK